MKTEEHLVYTVEIWLPLVNENLEIIGITQWTFLVVVN